MMPFSPEEIEAMSPAIREEIQEWLVQQHVARQRRAQFGQDPTQPKRRGNGWPHAWHSRHDDPIEEHLKKMDRHAWAALHLRKGSKEANGG